MESGETNPKKKSPATPVKPLSLNLKSAGGQKKDDGNDSSGSTTPDDAYQTPSMESVPFVENGKTEATSSAQEPKVSQSAKPKSQAFFVNMEVQAGSAATSGRGSSFDRNKPAAQSFTLHDHVHTPESAIAAGIPVVETARDEIMRSSSESSDAELKKIHADHRDSENKSKTPLSLRPETLKVSQPQVSTSNGPVEAAGPISPKTSFAELGARRLNGTSPLKVKGPETKSVKKTTFGALPNQTSWVESAQKHAHKPTSPKSDDHIDSSQPVTTDLMSIRMRLEERRRQIESERHRMELQKNKQRQRVGKQAFMQVVSKGGKTEGKVTRDKHEREKIPEVENESSPIRPEDAIECEEDVAEDYDTNLADLDDAASLEARRSTVQEAEPDDAGPAHDEHGTRATKRAWDKKHEQKPLITESTTLNKRSASPDVEKLNISNNSSQGATIREENVLQKPLDKVKGAGKSSSPSIIDQLKEEYAERHRKDSKSSSGSDTYNSSLEKLNSSLSELQGEIMKLSLKQEEIKNLHAETIGRTSSSSPINTVSQPESVTSRIETSPPRKETKPTRSGSEPDVAVRTSSPAVTGQMSSSGPQVYASPQQMSSHYGAPQPFVPPQMPYGAPPMYGGVNVSGGGYMPMHPHYPTMPQYQPPPMYQQPYGQMAPPAGYGYPPQGQFQPMAYTQPPETHAAPYQPSATYTVNARQVSPQSPVTSPVAEGR